MENKFRKEMQNPLIQLKLKMIRDNVNRWDTLWASYEGRYKEMSEDEIKAFNAELHVIATDTMNELSSIRKRFIKASVPFEEKPSEKSDILDVDGYRFAEEDCFKSACTSIS